MTRSAVPPARFSVTHDKKASTQRRLTSRDGQQELLLVGTQLQHGVDDGDELLPLVLALQRQKLQHQHT